MIAGISRGSLSSLRKLERVDDDDDDDDDDASAVTDSSVDVDDAMLSFF